MASVIKKMYEYGMKCPENVVKGICYETQFGSIAYGVNDNESDYDIYGVYVPPKRLLFPHLNADFIYNFSEKYTLSENDKVSLNKPWQLHHVKNPNIEREYDFTIYSLPHYFGLCTDNNPNLIDSLFTAERCVLFNTPVGKHIRDNRKLFLSKKTWHSFKGYAFKQLSFMRTKHEYSRLLSEIEKKYKIDYESFNELELLEKFSEQIKFHVYKNEDNIKKLKKLITKSKESLIEITKLKENMKFNLILNSKINSLLESFQDEILNLDSEFGPISDKNDINETLNIIVDEFPELKKISNSKDLFNYITLIKKYHSDPEGLTERKIKTRKYGFDVKFGYHIVRLIEEVEQILRESDLNLERKDRREILKSIRHGEWTLERIQEYFESKIKTLDEVYHSSTLQYNVNVKQIEKLLRECLEIHFGNLDDVIKQDINVEFILDEFDNILKKYRKV